MTYDEKLVERIRRVVPPTPNIFLSSMFGGVAFLVDGKMFVGVANNDLMVRAGPEAYAAALARTHVRPMDFTGRPLTGYIYVSADGTRSDVAVAEWVRVALAFVGTLPARTKTKKTRGQRPRVKRKAEARGSWWRVAGDASSTRRPCTAWIRLHRSGDGRVRRSTSRYFRTSKSATGYATPLTNTSISWSPGYGRRVVSCSNEIVDSSVMHARACSTTLRSLNTLARACRLLSRNERRSRPGAHGPPSQCWRSRTRIERHHRCGHVST